MNSADRLADLMVEDGDVPLAESLLLLAEARPHSPSVASRGLATLDDIAAACPDQSVDALVRHIFVEECFTGDRSDYHDPRNSYLDEVLERRVGMPITLSVVVIEAAKRIGIELVGIGMPGHFLVRERDDPDVFIDPFHAGARIGAAACEARFRSIHGDDVAFRPGYLDPVPARSIVQRVLNNLTVTFRSRSLPDLDWLLDIRLRIPADPPDLRALAGLCELRGRYRDAADLLDRVEDPVADQSADGRTRDHAQRLRARLN